MAEKGDLISRKALLAAYDAAHKGPPGGARKLIEEAPAINEPRVMTLEEIPECEQIPCWLEWRDGDSYYAIIQADGVKVEYARLFFICAFFKEEYGITVRCWTAKPTEKQRKAAKWNG